jgi:hypothetical protein
MTKLAGYMAFILFMGAAMHDANEEQRARLNSEVRPLLDAMRAKTAGEREMTAVMEKVLEVMGDNWQMNEESRKWIELMLGEK